MSHPRAVQPYYLRARRRGLTLKCWDDGTEHRIVLMGETINAGTWEPKP